MTQHEFIHYHNEHQKEIRLIGDRAATLHAAVAQTYGGYLPYAFHLNLTASFVTRFAHLLPDLQPKDILTLYAAAYFHDSIEDARLTYNDVMKEMHQLREAGCDIDAETATEAVYALTNDKGRTRQERAGEAYYAGIRATRFAPFLKMCDRLANVRYTTLYALSGRMHKVYSRELPHFLEAIGPVPQPMVERLKEYLADVVDG